VAKIANEARFFAKCEVCGVASDCDYIKYLFNGFELMYMVCMSCFSVARIAGLVNLRADIEVFEEQLNLGATTYETKTDD
jgi:hypothetical protein